MNWRTARRKRLKRERAQYRHSIYTAAMRELAKGLELFVRDVHGLRDNFVTLALSARFHSGGIVKSPWPMPALFDHEQEYVVGIDPARPGSDRSISAGYHRHPDGTLKLVELMPVREISAVNHDAYPWGGGPRFELIRERYWRDENGHLNCRHGVMLYGTKCVQCEREGKQEGKTDASKSDD